VVLPSSVVLTALEFDVLWESQRFPRRHVVLDVPSPGITHSGRAELVAKVWAGLEERGLADGRRPAEGLSDQLALLANPRRSVDGWIWTDREIRALAAVNGADAVLAVVDSGEVWLIPARDTSFVPAAISVAGDCPAGPGASVSLPLTLLREADQAAGGDAVAVIGELQERGLGVDESHRLAGMLAGMTTRGQFGAEVAGRNQRMHRADRVVAFHDTGQGRYLYLIRPSADGQQWVTVTPANNTLLATSVLEMLDELA
jgi:EspG family